MDSTKSPLVQCPNHLLSKLHVRQDPKYKFLFTKGRIGKSVSLKLTVNLYEPNDMILACFHHILVSTDLAEATHKRFQSL